MVAAEPDPAGSEPQPTVNLGEMESLDRADLDRLVLPDIRAEIVPVRSAGLGAGGLASPIHENMIALRPVVPRPGPDVVLPVIRNPDILTRFFRSRFNPISSALDGFVSIAMWIDERGVVEWAQVRNSSGRSELDGIALEAFNDIVSFTPARSPRGPIGIPILLHVPLGPW